MKTTAPATLRNCYPGTRTDIVELVDMGSITWCVLIIIGKQKGVAPFKFGPQNSGTRSL